MKQIEGCRVIDLMRDDRDMVKGVGVARLFREDLEESLLGLGQPPALWRRTARSKASKADMNEG